jgi:hypothetical protein
MYFIDGKHAKVELRSQQEIDGIIEKLVEAGFRPTLRQASHALLNAIGIDAGLSSAVCSDMMRSIMTEQRFHISKYRSLPRERPIGDIFCQDDSLLMVQPDRSMLVVCEIRPHGTNSRLEVFANTIYEAAKASLDGRRLRGMSFDWTPLPVHYYDEYGHFHHSAARRESNLAMKPAHMTPQEIESSRLLIEPNYRESLKRLVQVGKARAVDAKHDTDPGTMDLLIERGLLRKEFLVRCRMDSSTLCTVESREELESGFGERLRCPNCGRTFNKELLQEVYVPTSHAKSLINGSHWMTVWITDALIKSGVDKNSIYWGATAGEDEIDIIAEIHGQKVFFELKDREFGLGDAYPFNSRMQRYGADGGVIVSTERVAEEVKQFLNEQQALPILPIEGTEEVDSTLSSFVNRLSKAMAVRLAGKLFMLVELNIEAIVRAWIDGREAKVV